jgi:hypothetical protein
VSRRTITWKDVSHQITRAYQYGKPDHILLILVKEPADGLITNVEAYSNSVGKPFLVLPIIPIDLAKILLANHAIK